jgi:hypothetical protein
MCGQAVTVPVTMRTTTVTYPPTALDCNFDCNCLCNWINDQSGDFNWSLKNGTTITTITGPSVDHSTDSLFGFYVYIETSSPRVENDKARLISPEVNIPVKGGCFKFFYHMFGSDIYKLNIYIQTNNDPLTKPVWQKQGNKGDFWLSGSVYINNPFINTKFIIEGIVIYNFFILLEF